MPADAIGGPRSPRAANIPRPQDEKADRVSTALPAGNGAGEGAAAPPAPVTSPPADGGGEEARAQEVGPRGDPWQGFG